jgi:hypothetical protein
MAAALTFVGVTGTGEGDFTNGQIICDFTLALSGNYGGGATNGDTLNFANANVYSGQVPTNVQFSEQSPAGTANAGYFYEFCPGTTQSNGVVFISQCGAAGNPRSQITQGAAYPSALLTQVIKVRAYFAKNI